MTRKTARPQPHVRPSTSRAVPPLQAGRRARPDWRWRSFPVFAALSGGMLIAFVVNEGSANPAAFFLQIAALLGVGYSIAHLLVINVLGAGRTRRRIPEDETEDVIVHPDE